MTDHPQVDCRGIQVDEQMAPLLELLWDRGWRTNFSCQGSPSHEPPPSGGSCEAYISFEEDQAAFAFLQAMRPLGWDSFFLHPARFSLRLTQSGAVVDFNHEMLGVAIDTLAGRELDVAHYKELHMQWLQGAAEAKE